MKAIHVGDKAAGFPLTWDEAANPTLKPGEVLINVRAAGVNRADLLQRRGKYPPPPGASPILGLEVSGVIAELGRAVTGVAVGDRVCALLPGGGYATRVSVPADILWRVPTAWSFEEAAAAPEAYLTAFSNLFIEGDLKPGERALIHGGASGVGMAALQLLRLSNITAFATVGSAAKAFRAEKEGARRAINYREENFAEAVLAETGGEGVDVVLDIVGGPYAEDNLTVLRKGGRIVVIATMGGRTATLDLPTLMQKRARIVGSVLRPRAHEEKVLISRAFLARFEANMQSGALRPIVDTVFPIERAAEAHDRMERNENVGKLVLAVQGSRDRP